MVVESLNYLYIDPQGDKIVLECDDDIRSIEVDQIDHDIHKWGHLSISLINHSASASIITV